jgi:hypothetical protein
VFPFILGTIGRSESLLEETDERQASAWSVLRTLGVWIILPPNGELIYQYVLQRRTPKQTGHNRDEKQNKKKTTPRLGEGSFRKLAGHLKVKWVKLLFNVKFKGSNGSNLHFRPSSKAGHISMPCKGSTSHFARTTRRPQVAQFFLRDQGTVWAPRGVKWRRAQDNRG